MGNAITAADMAAFEIVDFVLAERAKALSTREWKHRLRGYGYDIRDTEQGQVVTALGRADALCILPANTPMQPRNIW